jgi:ssDNA-binding Zn-finger/Zn-ribbon topoisomerase 1
MPDNELLNGYWCDSCDNFFPEDEYDPQPSYECGNCGEVFIRDNSYDGMGHQCPVCNRFSALYADVGCPDCGEDMRETEAYWNGSTWVEVTEEAEDV